MSRVFTISVASVYPHYVNKVVRKGRTEQELRQVIEWLTGFDEAALDAHLAAGTTFEDFFAAAELNPLAGSITGTICGIRVEEIEDPLMQKIRYLDKLVDELARARRCRRSCAADGPALDGSLRRGHSDAAGGGYGAPAYEPKLQCTPSGSRTVNSREP